MEPNYQSIIITNAMGLAILFGLVVASNLIRRRQHLEDRLFSLLIAICAGGCIFEPITWFVDGIAEPWAVALNYLGNTCCYLGSCICPFIWVLYVDVRLHKGTNHIKNWHPVFLVPVVVLAIAILGNLFGHYMFTISDENVYTRQPLSYINYILMFAMFFYSVWLKKRYERKHGRVRFFPMAMFLAPVFIGASIQALWFGISLSWPSMCIGLVNLHMSIQNELSFIDPLTNLFNRTYLNSTLRMMERSGNRFGGIMIDLDDFKYINDTFGHSAGDVALAQTAQIIAETAGEKATVFRYAGDEFVVLAADADTERAEQMKQAIVDAIDELNRTGENPYRIKLSM